MADQYVSHADVVAAVRALLDSYAADPTTDPTTLADGSVAPATTLSGPGVSPSEAQDLEARDLEASRGGDETTPCAQLAVLQIEDEVAALSIQAAALPVQGAALPGHGASLQVQGAALQVQDAALQTQIAAAMIQHSSPSQPFFKFPTYIQQNGLFVTPGSCTHGQLQSAAAAATPGSNFFTRLPAELTNMIIKKNNLVENIAHVIGVVRSVGANAAGPLSVLEFRLTRGMLFLSFTLV